MPRLRAFLEVIIRMIVIMAVVYTVICGALWALQKHIVFVPIQEVTAAPEDFKVDEVNFQSSDWVKLHGWFDDNGGKYTVLFFHGNGGNILYNSERLALFRDLKVNSLLFDYRSYGQSEGSIESENDFYTDAQAAYDYMLSRGIPANRIILWGHSLGGAVAIHTALGKETKLLVAESSFTSMDDMATGRYPIFPIRLLLEYHFPSIDRISEVWSPILFMHSRTDQVVPFEQGRQLFEKATAKKDFQEISGMHNSGPEHSYDTYINTVGRILAD